MVGIPSRLSVAECARLLSALAEQGVSVNHLVVNQIVDGAASESYVQRVAAEQGRALASVDGGAPARRNWTASAAQGVQYYRHLAETAGYRTTLWPQTSKGQLSRFTAP